MDIRRLFLGGFWGSGGFGGLTMKLRILGFVGGSCISGSSGLGGEKEDFF